MTVKIIIGDARERLLDLPSGSVQTCVTSPPYFGLRDYGVAGQIGLEPLPDAYISELVAVFRGVRRVLREDGTLWLNLGDSYANDGKWGGNGRGKKSTGLKSKDLMMIPARVAIALQAGGWYLRSEIVWHKPNPIPESVTDRPTSSHEKIFLLSKSKRYFFDANAIREAESVPDWDDGSRVFGGINKNGANLAHGDRTTGRIASKRKRGLPPRHAGYETCDRSGLDDVVRGGGRNARNVWTIATGAFSEAHFAVFPPELARRCIEAGCPASGTVLDPFGGAGTTGLVADRLGRDVILIELNPEYAGMAQRRIERDAGLFASVVAV